MLIELISQSNYQSYNVIIARTFGLETAVYLNALVEINEKAIRKNKLFEQHFHINRKYITDRTTLTTSQQKNIEETLESVDIIHKNGMDCIRVDIDTLISLMAAENEGVIKDLSGLKNNVSTKTQKSMSILKAVKSNINENYPDELKAAYEEWLDVIMNKFGFVSKQMLFQAQTCVDKEANHDMDKAINIIHIASANGWKDMSYAAKKYNQNNSNLVKVHRNKIDVSGGNILIMICAYAENCKLSNSDYCSEFCERYVKLDYLFSTSYIPKNGLKTITLYIDSDGSDKGAFEFLKQIQLNIKEVVDQGLNLYLYSNIPGNGKTSWAIKLAKSYIYSIWYICDLEPKVLYINVPSYLLELKANISEKSEYIKHIKQYVLKCDIVIWDDIATKSATEFEHEHLLSMIDNRLYNSKSNIFTSNIAPDELDNFLGSRLASRIINEARLVEFRGKDKRGLSWKL